MKKEPKDFYYSRSMEEQHRTSPSIFELEDGAPLESEYEQHNVLIGPTWYVYTLVTDKGRKLELDIPDLVYVGSTDGSPELIKRGKIPAMRKFVEMKERNCTGICQLCVSSCYVRTIKNVYLNE